jgi:polysaccharide biosynthesis/export protein
MKKLCRYIVPTLAALLLGACTQDFAQIADKPLAVEASPDLNTTPGDYRLRPYDVLVADYFFNLQPQEHYIIQNGDEFEIRFATAPDLNVQQTVRPDGRVSLPYIGDVVIAGKTPEQANAMLKTRYDGKFRDTDIFFFLRRSRAAVEELRSVVTSNDRGQSKAILVRPDGRITLPGIGELPAEGRVLAEVNAEANKLYGDRWNGVSVDLGLQTTRNLFVYVLGAVNTPGAYTINAPVSVQQAVAMAGGYRDRADMDQFYVLRKTGQQYAFTRYDAKMLFVADKPRVMELRSDDVVYIPRSGLNQAADVMQDVTRMITFNGVGGSVSYQLNNN